MPPAIEITNGQYIIEPYPPILMLLLPPAAFLHYLHYHRSHYSKSLFWMPRIPRYICGRPFLDRHNSQPTYQIGWGIHIREGFKFLNILLLTLAQLIASILLGTILGISWGKNIQTQFYYIESFLSANYLGLTLLIMAPSNSFELPGANLARFVFFRVLLLLFAKKPANSIPESHILNEWSIVDADVSTFSNKAKRVMEDSNGYKWDWWPFSPRIRPIVTDKSRLRWRCVSSTSYSLIFPLE